VVGHQVIREELLCSLQPIFHELVFVRKKTHPQSFLAFVGFRLPCSEAMRLATLLKPGPRIGIPIFDFGAFFVDQIEVSEEILA
jgi:hypothetical protein